MDGLNLIKDYISKNNEIVVFCGAGTSIPLGLPNWKDLTENLVNTISEKYDVPKIKAILPALDAGIISILDVLEHVSDKTYLNTVLEKLQDQIKIKIENFEVHQTICDLSKKIITTNYDSAFETFAKGNLEKILSTDKFEIANLSKHSGFIFKIHGDIAKPTSCVLFKKQYEELYSKTISGYFLEMAKMFSDKTFLFIGFSLSDPYIMELFDSVDKAYDGHTSKHFIITTEPEKFTKFRDYILPINIKSHTDLNDLLIDLRDHKKSFEKPIEEIVSKSEILHDAKIKIFIPRPIDKIIEFNKELIVSSFANFNVELTEGYFNIEKIKEIDDSDYVFIFTQIIKGQILIEDESLRYKLVRITELNTLLSNESLKGVFLFVDDKANDSVENITGIEDLAIPLMLIPIDSQKSKELLNSITYKAFNKADIKMFRDTFILFNEKNLCLQKLKKGKFHRNKSNTFISQFIDKKNFSKFVGRKSDQENIARKILANRYENKLLSIKGSGGIGKTTIISKIGIELAERGYFEKGVHFITCNPIQSYENFEFEISQCFNLTSSKLLREQIQDTVFVKDRIIILDNFETLLYSADRQEILDLVSFLCDYSVMVVTTRQILDLEFEEIYELRNLTSDEAVELFKEFYPTKVGEIQEKFLRREILEKLLNNNPLAIKLIVKGLPASKMLETLKEELENNIFNEDDINEIFESDEDYNIERSASLYHSINYSYVNLTNNEKLAFEILSLFPDGMHMENFKTFCKSSKDKSTTIGDREIKLLDNKSLLENSNGFLKLQSIIGRFSDYKFKKRSEEERLHYYKTAYSYNNFFIDVVANNTGLQNSVGLKILDLNTNNYLKCLEFLSLISLTAEEKITFISHVSYIFRDTNQPVEFLKFLNSHDFDFDNNLKNLLELVKQHVIYWTQNFKEPFEYVKHNYSFETLNLLDYNDNIQKLTMNRVIAIYRTEGFDFEILKILINKKIHKTKPSDIFFKLGYYIEAQSIIPAKENDKTYFDFEIDLANDNLTVNNINKYMGSLYKKENLELTQMTYLKSKITKVTNDEIKKLVISNPYTRGLIFLMEARNESDIKIKRKLFDKAKENLKHVKYHYVECLIFYLYDLKDYISIEDFENIWIEAISISKKFYFRKFIHELNEFKDPNFEDVFDFDYYPIPIDNKILKEFLITQIKMNKTYYKRSSTILQRSIS